ncbi:MAG: WGR domain-containing protein [Verrucomicrobia bacterium]|nr:MAG: WGR domain-containing protein [Verrucomicrobiota bacterium]
MHYSYHPIRLAVSDKVYHAAIEPSGEGYLVTFAYGRRGNTLTTGTKTNFPVTFADATKTFNKLISSKLAKGYQYSSASAGNATPYQQNGNEGTDSGIRCQLLNAIDASEVSRLLRDSRYCLQEKHDGRRLMILKKDDEITGINRRGFVVAIPDAIRDAVEQIPFDVLRNRRYIDRFASLMMALPGRTPALRWCTTTVNVDDKIAAYEELRATNCEGAVFKDMDAPYSPGRPNSGGPQLKFKFVESASFVVTGINAQRSVMLGLYRGDSLISAGNVTIPPNHDIPAKGDVVEVRYLYAFQESGSIYQPVYLGKRSDIPTTDCVIEQLKYKNAAA